MKRIWIFTALAVLVTTALIFMGSTALAEEETGNPGLAQTGADPSTIAGGDIQSLSGSFVEFDDSVGGDTCYIPGASQTFCFRAESFSPDWEYVYNLWQMFPTDWTVTNVYLEGTPWCDNGSFGSFSWSFQTSPYEVNIYHPRYQGSGGAHCIAYYCFEVTSGTGEPEALQSWYWDGDGYGVAPHNPCSDDNYTPAGQNACDEAINPQAAVPPCSIDPGVYLLPPSREGSGCNGLPATYGFSLLNQTGSDGTFDLDYDVPSANGTLTGPAQLTVPDGATQPFEVELTPNLCTEDGEEVIGLIDVSGNGYDNQAVITHTISTIPSWEQIPASAPSWAGVGYPRDGCTAQNADGDWVTYLLGDTTSISGFWGYNHDTNTWYNPGAANTPANRWAPDWAYDAETNLCYVTGGANTPGGGTYNEAYVFDPVANAFTQLGNFTSIRAFHNSWVGTLDGVNYLCIGGGVNASSILVQATQCYDLSQSLPGVWEAENAQMDAFPTDPFGAADGVLHAPTGDQFWYVGGAIDNFATVTDEAWYWDDADNAWHLAGNTGVPRYRVEGDFLDGNFYQLGGSSGGFTPTTDAVRGSFDGENWVWELLPDMENARMDNIANAAGGTMWSVDGYGASTAAYVEYLVFCPECAPTFDAWKEAPDFAEPGEVINYTIFVEAAMLMDGMYMVDPLPEGVEYAGNLTWTDGEAWYDEDDNTVYWEYYEPEAVGEPASPGVYDPDAVADLVGAVEPSGAPLPEGDVKTFSYPLSVLWDNGPLVTHPGGGFGGADASRLQTTLAMNTLGFGHQFINGYRMADDFEITDPSGWWIDTVTFFAYQTGAPIDPSTITGIYFQIWDGSPDDPGSSIVWGDLATNRLLDSAWSNIYRDSESSPNLDNRPIMASTASAGLFLPAGTYWLDWMSDGTLSSGPWAPPITILGETTTGNAMQYTTAWAPALDTGTTTQQGMPFIIEGEVGSIEPVLVEISFDVTVTGIHGDLIVNEGWAGMFEGEEVTFEAVTEVVGTPAIDVDPLELWAEVLVDTTAMETLNICNEGTAPLEWEIHEMAPPLQALGSPFVPVEVTGQGINPGLTTASPSGVPEVVPATIAQDVLWDQPLSAVNQNAYVNQEFGDAPDFSSFLADDFVNDFPWEISTIFVPGNGWNGFTTLLNATELTWQIYEDCAGEPCGDPSGVGSPPVWTLTLPPDDEQVVITTGTGGFPSDVELILDEPGVLPPGTWWLVFYPTMDFGVGGQHGRQPADTTNGYFGQFINPGGGFGYGPDWLDWTIIGATQQDIAFRIEGQEIVYEDVPWLSEDPISGEVLPGECQEVEVTFDATGMEPGDYFADLVILSNDPMTPEVIVPVTMTVFEPTYIQVAHLAPFAEDASVTITLNGEDALVDFGYGDSTEYILLPSGEYDVAVIPTGAMDPAIEATVMLEAYTNYTVIAVGDGDNQDLDLVLLEDDLTEPAEGMFHLRLGHLAPFAEGLATADIRLQDGTPVLLDVNFGDVTAFIPLDAGEYDLKITTPGGEVTLIDPLPVDFAEGMIISAFATGEGVNQDLGVFALPAGDLGFFLPLYVEPEPDVFYLFAPMVFKDAEVMEIFNLTILHTNDFHARVDQYNRNGARCTEADADAGLCIAGAPRIATVVDDFRANTGNLLVLDAGDQFQGTLFFTLFQSEVLNTTANYIGYDAMAVGNHEFDSGPAELAAFINGSDFPLLSANIDASEDPDLAGLILPYVILERGGHEIGIIGLTTPDTENISSPGEFISFDDPLTSLQATADELTALGVNKIIALTHQGYDMDLALAQDVTGVDIIIGGHSHTFTYTPTDPIKFGPPEFPQYDPLAPAGEYPTVVDSPSGEPVLVVTAYQWGTFLGNLYVTFCPEGLVQFYDGNPIFLGADVEKDAVLDGILDPYREAIQELIETVVGETTVDLPINVGGVRICRVGECLLGNLVADAMLWMANEVEPEAGYQIAFQNGGGLRAPIFAGEVTMGDVLETLPFGNTIATFQLQGVYVKEALENGASRYPSENGGFAQVAGLNYTIDPSQEVGERIVYVEVWNGTEWEELDPDAMYKVVTNDFMRRGGDNYTMFRDYAVDPYDFGPLLDEALANYFGEFSPVTPEFEDRVIILP
jgi:5'-nucleotidase / UDP-sugar diphosphatase